MSGPVRTLPIEPPGASGDELQRALDLRDQFLAVAAHELKTPLMGLRLQADLARRQLAGGVAPADVLRKLLEGNDRHRAHLERFADDLLDAARLATGQLSLQRERVELGPLAAEVVGRFGDAAQRARSPLSLEAEAGAVAFCDRVRIDQVLSNLLTNAIRYAPGSPIRVRACSTADRARIEVSDEGPGIPREDQQRVFERFERGRGQEVLGLGLGLFIVREIVEGHGGTVRLESAPGAGATFVVDLPTG